MENIQKVDDPEANSVSLALPPSAMRESRGSQGVRRVLISTVSPETGGVATNVRFISKTLRSRGYEPILAYYEPYSRSPHLSVPSFRLLQRRIGRESRTALDDCEAHAIGAWLPELEFTHYLATPAWRQLMETCDAHLAVAGNVLAGLPYLQTRRPSLSWISSGWHADRKDRVFKFSTSRKVVDHTIVSPIVRRLEKSLLRSGCILAASDYTRCLLDDIAGVPVVKDVLSIPIDTDFFNPAPNVRLSGRIGFSGRLSDPRKNIGLLLEALQVLRRSGHNVSALLMGGAIDGQLRRQIQDLGLGDVIEVCPHVPRETMRDNLRTLDVFVVPSYQEGLCISALEGMACGCPVVSTRCGGPEEFVIESETGLLVGFEPAEMAEAILSILSDPKLRQRLGEAAREKVVRDYSLARANGVFWGAFADRFPSAA